MHRRQGLCSQDRISTHRLNVHSFSLVLASHCRQPVRSRGWRSDCSLHCPICFAADVVIKACKDVQVLLQCFFRTLRLMMFSSAVCRLQACRWRGNARVGAPRSNSSAVPALPDSGQMLDRFGATAGRRWAGAFAERARRCKWRALGDRTRWWRRLENHGTVSVVHS